MISRNKILKISLTLLSFILLVSIFLVVTFFLKKTQWKDVYRNDTVKYLNENMFEFSEERFVGTLWAYEILPFDKDIIVGFNSPDGDVKLYLNQENISLREEIDFVDTEYGKYAPVFLSVEIKKDKGTILDQLKCVLGKEDRCITKVDIFDVQIYENRYPYPTLTDEQSKEFTLFNIKRYEKSFIAYDDNENMLCYYLMSEYIVNKNSDVLEELSNMACSDYSAPLLYANLVEKGDPLYKQTQERVCNSFFKLKQEDAESLFLPTALRIYNEMCNSSFTISDNQHEYSEDNIRRTSANILFLLNNVEDVRSNDRMIKMKEILTRDLFTSFASPTCLYLYMCNEELVNLSRVIFE